MKTSRIKLFASNLPTDAPFLPEGRCALLLFYMPFVIIVFQVQEVQLWLAIVVLELLHAERKISKATKVSGGSRGRGVQLPPAPLSDLKT